MLPSPGDVGWVATTAKGDTVELRLDQLAVSALDACVLASDDPTTLTPGLRRLAELANPQLVSRRPSPERRGDAPITLAEFQLLAVELKRLIQESTPADGAAVAVPVATRPLPLTLRRSPGADVLDSVLGTFDAVAGAEDWAGLTVDQQAELARLGLVPSPIADPAADFASMQSRLARRRKAANRVEAVDTIAGMRARVAQFTGVAVPLLVPFELPGPGGGVEFSATLAGVDEIDDWFDVVATCTPTSARCGEPSSSAACDRRADAGRRAGAAADGRPVGGAAPAGAGHRWPGRRRGGHPRHRRPAAPVVGLVVDRWSERIPGPDQVTGVAFHFDAPSTEAPQTMLLAVTPEGDRGAPTWCSTRCSRRSSGCSCARWRSTTSATTATPCRRHMPGLLDGAAGRGGVVIGPWDRIEGSSRDDELDAGVEARVADPLWMLTRQWQVGELRGDDAGKPIAARMEWQATALRTYRPATTARRADADDAPLERVVEAAPPPRRCGRTALVVPARRPARPPPGARRARRRSCRARRGRAFELPPTTRWPCPVPGRPPSGCCAGAASTVPPSSPPTSRDRRGACRPAGDDARRALGVISGGRPPPGAIRQPPRDTWDETRLEHRFSLTAGTGDSEVVLAAGEYTGGHLDWYSFDIEPRGGPNTKPPVIDEPPASTSRRSSTRGQPSRSRRSRHRSATPGCRRRDGGRSRRGTCTSATSPRRPAISAGCSSPTTSRCTATTGTRSRCGSRRAPCRRSSLRVHDTMGRAPRSHPPP